MACSCCTHITAATMLSARMSRQALSGTSRRFKSDLAVHQLKPLSGLSETVLKTTGGRSSISGITATVFGSSGFVSRYVCNRLARIGSQIFVPYRGDGLNVRHLKLMGDLGQIVPLSFNVNDRDSITRSVARSNVVINLMGSRRETLNHSYNDVHALAAKRVAECARAAGAERLIHFSALGASEDSPSAFFRSKAAGEKAVLEAFPNATIVRPGPVFGPEDWLLQRMAGLIHHDSVVPFLEDNDQKMQPVWVNDVAAGVMNIILNDSTKGRIVEMAGPEVLTDVQIALRVHQVLQEENVIKRYSDSHYRMFLAMRQFMPHWRKWYPADLYEQQQVSLTASGSSDVLTFNDLGIKNLKTLDSCIEFCLKTQEQKEIEFDPVKNFE